MTNDEIISEIAKRETELATQAEWEFDEVLKPKALDNIKGLHLNEDVTLLMMETMKFSFISGARYGFLKYIENRLEQNKCKEP